MGLGRGKGSYPSSLLPLPKPRTFLTSSSLPNKELFGELGLPPSSPGVRFFFLLFFVFSCFFLGWKVEFFGRRERRVNPSPNPNSSAASSKSLICQNSVDKRDFVSYAMMSAKQSVAHRPKIRQSSKPNKERKQPRILVPPDSSVSIRTEGTTVQLCGDSKVAEKWINGGHCTNGTNISGQIWMDSGNTACMVEEKNRVSSGTD